MAASKSVTASVRMPQIFFRPVYVVDPFDPAGNPRDGFDCLADRDGSAVVISTDFAASKRGLHD
jgi:hypothetical protein